MNRQNRQHRRTGALWLMVLAIVSVLAPVWADTYVCPMAKEALEKSPSCCAKAEVTDLRTSPGFPQFEPPCDCPKLSWSADLNDQTRELRHASEHAVALLEHTSLPLEVQFPVQVASRPSVLLHPGAIGSIWLRNQAILC